MNGRKQTAASTPSRERVSRLPDQLTIKCPAGTRRALEREAEHEGMPPADYLRRMVRRALDASRKRRERRG